jgi:hypothetical protein
MEHRSKAHTLGLSARSAGTFRQLLSLGQVAFYLLNREIGKNVQCIRGRDQNCDVYTHC